MFIIQAPKENTSNIGQFGFLKHFQNSEAHKTRDFLILFHSAYSVIKGNGFHKYTHTF